MTRWLILAALSLPALVACAPDADGDGFSGSADCDDSNADVFPQATELCDGIDNNCDGIIDVDADDEATWFLDNDGDGSGDRRFAVQACEAPEGYVAANDDCDDTDERFRPGAVEDDCTDPNDYNCDGSVGYDDADADGFPACQDCNDASADQNPSKLELCNSIDDDCDGDTDESDAIDADTFFADEDDDGFGDPDAEIRACSLPEGASVDDSDCDDTEASINPDGTELCDEVDNDCDNEIDEDDAEDAPTWYSDLDGDGFGGARLSQRACVQPEGTTAEADDCDDLRADANPDADELCNGADDDCDGTTDEPDAVDAPTWYADGDKDGFGDADTTQRACAAPAGYLADATDCDDAVATTYPGADETCNGDDDDCDGTTDEDDAIDAPVWFADGDGDGFGDKRLARRACAQPSGYVSDQTDCDDLRKEVKPGGAELCNTIDDDCDGTVDEDDAVDARTWYADTDGDGFGDALEADTACAAPRGYVADKTDCDDAERSTYPGADETCDGEDDDCDGTTDEDDAVDAKTLYADADADGYGDPRYSAKTCTTKTGYVSNDDDCNDLDDEVNPKAVETCDGVDDDCDGDKTDGLLGSGETCPADHCAAILADQSAAKDGDYWLEDTDGSAYEVECDMANGGWTIITGELLDDRDWVDFDITGGSSTAALGEWTTNVGEFRLVPDNGITTFSCAGVAVRATATLPFDFDEWQGTWDGSGEGSSANSDDDSTTTDWGETTATTCSGHFKFGTDLDDEKEGGDWGFSWNSSRSRTYSWTKTSISSTDTIRWETMDNYDTEAVVVTDIEIKVR